MIQASMTSGLISHTRTLFLQPFLCRQILLFFSSLQEKLLASNTCLLKLEFPDYWLSKDLRDSKTSVKVLNLRINCFERICIHCWLRVHLKNQSNQKAKGDTTLQSMMNAKLSPHWFWRCCENGLNETIQTGSTRQFKRHPITY